MPQTSERARVWAGLSLALTLLALPFAAESTETTRFPAPTTSRSACGKVDESRRLECLDADAFLNEVKTVYKGCFTLEAAQEGYYFETDKVCEGKRGRVERRDQQWRELPKDVSRRRARSALQPP